VIFVISNTNLKVVYGCGAANKGCMLGSPLSHSTLPSLAKVGFTGLRTAAVDHKWPIWGP
jgi:hypothetical protein